MSEVDNGDSKMHLYYCDGMPSFAGCSSEIETSVAYRRQGEKKSGWLVLPNVDDDYKPILDLPMLHFCPSCAAVVREQEAKRKAEQAK